MTQQRVGPVTIDLREGDRDDLTIVEVPESCVGFVMGKQGATLRSMEEEWGTLMFFAQVMEHDVDEQERLCIFGTLKARRGAELKVQCPHLVPCQSKGPRNCWTVANRSCLPLSTSDQVTSCAVRTLSRAAGSPAMTHRRTGAQIACSSVTMTSRTLLAPRVPLDAS